MGQLHSGAYGCTENYRNRLIRRFDRDRVRLRWVSVRIKVSVVVGLIAGTVAGFAHAGQLSDLTQLVDAARAWLLGADPYTVRYGPFPLLYPFPAVLIAAPLTFVQSPEFWFIGIGSGLFVYATWERFPYAWLALITPAFWQAVLVVQWPALLIGAALVPYLGFLLACKPTIGTALFAAFPSPVTLIGGLLFGLVSLIVYPTWPLHWFEALKGAGHMQAPITFWLGPLILFALPRWRSWDARLLLALACVPQTNFYYDALPLWLIPQTWDRALALTLLGWAIPILQQAIIGVDGGTSQAAYLLERQFIGQASVLLLYLPCLWMVLSPAKVRQRASAMLPSEA